MFKIGIGIAIGIHPLPAKPSPHNDWVISEREYIVMEFGQAEAWTLNSIGYLTETLT